MFGHICGSGDCEMKDRRAFAVATLVLLACSAIWALIRRCGRGTLEPDQFKLKITQAARMRWRKASEVTHDGQGAAWAHRSVHFVRGEEETVLWHKDATITLLRDHGPLAFVDFIELEQWLRQSSRDPETDGMAGESAYLQEVERFVMRHGYYLRLREAAAADRAFLLAVTAFHETAYAAREEPVVVGALTLEAFMRYQKDRNAGLRFLAGQVNEFSREQLAELGNSDQSERLCREKCHH